MNVTEHNLVKLEPMLLAEVRGGHARGAHSLGCSCGGLCIALQPRFFARLSCFAYYS